MGGANGAGTAHGTAQAVAVRRLQRQAARRQRQASSTVAAASYAARLLLLLLLLVQAATAAEEEFETNETPENLQLAPPPPFRRCEAHKCCQERMTISVVYLSAKHRL